jgi:hypothetical protein
MARLTASERAKKGAKFLDKQRPGWFKEPDIDPETVDIWNLRSDSGLGRIFSLWNIPPTPIELQEMAWLRRTHPEREKVKPPDYSKLNFWQIVEKDTGRIRGLSDAAAEEHGFRVPNFDCYSEQEYQDKRKAFAERLTKAWQEEILFRINTLPICKPTVSGRGIGQLSFGGNEEFSPKATAT